MKLGVPRPRINLSVALRALIKATVGSQRAVVKAVGPALSDDSLSKMLNGKTPMERFQFDKIVEACLPKLPQDEQQGRRQQLEELWDLWAAASTESAAVPQQQGSSSEAPGLPVQPEAPAVWSMRTLRQGQELPRRTHTKMWEFYGLEWPLEETPGRRRPRLYVSTGLILVCAGPVYYVQDTTWLLIVLGLLWLPILATEIPQQLRRYPLRHVRGTPPEATRLPTRWRRPGQPEIAWYVGDEDLEGVTAVLSARPSDRLSNYRPATGWLRLSNATPGIPPE
ncbi:hypothetical protein AB0D04_36620 [Streptomyces sp. NPDC048483]|uniref:hypothetical protein n=1 Tax=Streptomyces sp. NPDC048483 TaxID=3154927 RepID=UPI00342D794F